MPSIHTVSSANRNGAIKILGCKGDSAVSHIDITSQIGVSLSTLTFCQCWRSLKATIGTQCSHYTALRNDAVLVMTRSTTKCLQLPDFVTDRGYCNVQGSLSASAHLQSSCCSTHLHIWLCICPLCPTLSAAAVLPEPVADHSLSQSGLVWAYSLLYRCFEIRVKSNLMSLVCCADEGIIADVQLHIRTRGLSVGSICAAVGLNTSVIAAATCLFCCWRICNQQK